MILHENQYIATVEQNHMVAITTGCEEGNLIQLRRTWIMQLNCLYLPLQN